jgi:hypothetical protein
MLRLLRNFVVIGPLIGLAISGNLWTILPRELSLKGLGANHELPKLTDFPLRNLRSTYLQRQLTLAP